MIRVARVPDHGVTVVAIARIHRERAGVELLLGLDAMPQAWKDLATRPTKSAAR